ncbi:MAG: aspartate/glutamate racemase family protein [Janthinobacterium lividum]
MSWESSAEYYRLADELVRERLGGLHSARLVLGSVDFADIEALQTAGRWDEAGALLAEIAKGLEAARADLLLLCTNTIIWSLTKDRGSSRHRCFTSRRRCAGRTRGWAGDGWPLGHGVHDGGGFLRGPARRSRACCARPAR